MVTCQWDTTGRLWHLEAREGVPHIYWDYTRSSNMRAEDLSPGFDNTEFDGDMDKSSDERRLTGKG